MLSRQELHVGSPGANHEAGIDAQSEAFQAAINLCEPHQKFCQDRNRSLVTRYARSNVPDGIVGVHLRYTVVDSLEREHGVISIWQDLAVFETASSETTESVVSTVRHSISHHVQLYSPTTDCPPVAAAQESYRAAPGRGRGRLGDSGDSSVSGS